jgi:hypothetical protein
MKHYLNMFHIVPQNTGETAPQNDYFVGAEIFCTGRQTDRMHEYEKAYF